MSPRSIPVKNRFGLAYGLPQNHHEVLDQNSLGSFLHKAFYLYTHPPPPHEI
jgi:hypothetical protein